MDTNSNRDYNQIKQHCLILTPRNLWGYTYILVPHSQLVLYNRKE
jgi:hypothetical protein